MAKKKAALDKPEAALHHWSELCHETRRLTGQLAYLRLQHVRTGQIAALILGLGAPQVVSNGVVLVALVAPLLLAAEMVANCWVHGRTRQTCDPDGQVPGMVKDVVVTTFAWLAKPPG